MTARDAMCFAGRAVCIFTGYHSLPVQSERAALGPSGLLLWRAREPIRLNGPSTSPFIPFFFAVAVPPFPLPELFALAERRPASARAATAEQHFWPGFLFVLLPLAPLLIPESLVGGWHLPAWLPHRHVVPRRSAIFGPCLRSSATFWQAIRKRQPPCAPSRHLAGR